MNLYYRMIERISELKMIYFKAISNVDVEISVIFYWLLINPYNYLALTS